MRVWWMLLLVGCSGAPDDGERTCYSRVESGASLSIAQELVVERRGGEVEVEVDIEGPLVSLHGSYAGPIQGSEAVISGIERGGVDQESPVRVQLEFGRGEVSLTRPGGSAVLTESACPS